MNIENLKKQLKRLNKDTLIVVVILMVIALSLFYPITKKIFQINNKINAISIKVNNIKENVSNLKMINKTDIQIMLENNNNVIEKDISKRIDVLYNAGIHMITQMNGNVIDELNNVSKGNKTMLEAMKAMEEKNEELLREYKYMDSLRQNFWNRNWNMEVKPLNEGRVMK